MTWPVAKHHVIQLIVNVIKNIELWINEFWLQEPTDLSAPI
jgi:hypothetical protein